MHNKSYQVKMVEMNFKKFQINKYKKRTSQNKPIVQEDVITASQETQESIPWFRSL